MQRVWRSLLIQKHLTIMATPSKQTASSDKEPKIAAHVTPIDILLQMGYPRKRACKALAATGTSNVLLASDWLMAHAKDAHIDDNEPRTYALYACPTRPLLHQLLEFWEKSKAIAGWNGAHNLMPHITLVPPFKAPDDMAPLLTDSVKQAIENAGKPPSSLLKLEPYVSKNFMGLFVSENYSEYLKRIAQEYAKIAVSALGDTEYAYNYSAAVGSYLPWSTIRAKKSINLEVPTTSVHMTLAYHFEESAFGALKNLVEHLQPLDDASWEIRLYSEDSRFTDHQVYKVIEAYEPKAGGELELVPGDYIYVDKKDLRHSTDGWVQGTSWLTGVKDLCNPAVYTRRTAASDAWTVHCSAPINIDLSKSKPDCKMADDYPQGDAARMGRDVSEDSFKNWEKFWTRDETKANSGFVDIAHGSSMDWKEGINGARSQTDSASQNGDGDNEPRKDRRWFFALRHGERVDLTYGNWVPYCFDENGKYVRKDLNMPVTLGERAGGKDAYSRDTPLTRVGRLQAQLVGEGLRLAGVSVRHVYASAALRCVETAHEFLAGLQADPSVKIRVDPGLFEFKGWHMAKGLMPFMTPLELHKAGYNVDLNYKPYVELDIKSTETLEECYERTAKVMQAAVKDTEAEGGNVIYVGHASTLDTMATALKRMGSDKGQHPPYQISKHLLRVPYCSLGAMLDKPWTVVCPPVPPCINSSSGKFDWTMLLDKH